MVDAYSYLGWDSVKVLSQHPPHVFACVRGHLVLQQEGELATVSDAVEVAVDLVVLATCQKKKENSPSCNLSIRRFICVRQPKPAKAPKATLSA